MINRILKMLSISEYYGESERIEIAKGKYELKSGWYNIYKQIKRRWRLKE
jgi:hypothetical protein